MLRTAVWTLVLFGAGAALIGVFPQPWAQPLVLLALGFVFLWASARRPAPAAAALPAPAPLPSVVRQAHHGRTPARPAEPAGGALVQDPG